ncbi:diacylglycerol kinase theta isoform X5 [Anopheles arabiensis]|uniref:Diacylglycerol kinase n=2 Tax=gambiae species complex TaxID=44542 RepID=A0A453YR02_ANOGA|nr:diacylglycerol kinase theta isoform X5 [Anopheles arabiensis]XP_040241439.1 diacylglycerol kinase theta isoform X6 [Anopheles coluzzii]XP_061502126.1 diacylglycerol kinase theta isoform X5 [Anopheles gambiae]
MAGGEHTFGRKTFHKPTYCHHCSDLLWGLIGQGYICEVCNFIVHEKCVTNIVTPCTGVAPYLIRNPVAHCWSEPSHHKRKFCSVCRKRLDETPAVHCLICEHFAHVECQDFAIPDCKENATYVPGKELGHVKHQHHWREGNLPQSSKCAYCKKTCWSYECLTGYRCEWCGTTTHGGCRNNISAECTFGTLQPIYLPPHAVSIPRTEVPMEAIIGVQNRNKGTPGLQRDYSCPRSISEEITTENRYRDDEYVPRGESSGSGTHSKPDSAHKPDKDKDKKDKDKEERDEETIKVFDGNCSYRRRIFRAINVPRTCSLEQLLTTALRAFHIARDPNLFFLTDVYGDEVRLQDPTPVPGLHRVEGKRPAIYLRFRDKENDHGFVRVYPGKLQVENAYVIIPVDNDTTVKDLICESLKKFGLQSHQIEDYRCSEILLDRGVTERVLSWNERPWEIMKQLGKDSIRQMELMRFYLQLKQDPHGPNLALFVGNLPPGLSQRNYEHILTEFLGFENKFSSIGPIYYEYGSLVITYENASKAVRAFQALRESKYEEKHLLVLLLPNIEPSMVPAGVQPLLVFVNVKSGGCQGLELISSFRKLLNPYQVFDLDNGGPLPGLYVFRHIQDYKILVCGGDGTIGWVLQCLDNVGQDSECSSPPCAIVPLGTGNDLARVLRWGAGYTGGEDPLNLLRDVIDAEEIRLDRWTVVFHPEDKPEDATPKAQPNSTVVGGAQSEDNSQIFVMNNYFGIGIDADLCLDFHNAREENPNKFNSRLHNKGVYVKMGLRKMVGRKMVKELHKELRLEVDGKVVELPPVEGIIILNILSWGSGANPWGPEKEDQFSKPNHWDGMLEVVGVTGVVHLGQIQSGLRSAMRIAQGGHIKIHLHSDIPVQVDGEPWVQSPGDVVVLKSALKATMLKKIKSKRRLTEPHISPAVAGFSQGGAPENGDRDKDALSGT